MLLDLRHAPAHCHNTDPMASISSTARRPATLFIFFVALLDVLGFGLIIPVLPHLVEDFVGGDTAHAALYVGAFSVAWALMQFLFSPVLGSLSDRFGRRPVILISCFGLGLDYVLMAMAPSLAWLFVGRVISGITAASFSTASAYLADVNPPEKRGAAYGLLGAAFGIGFVVGPAVGGLLVDIDPRAPFWMAAVLSLLNAMYGLFVLPESLPPEKRSPSINWRRANPVGSLKLLRSHPELSGLASVAGLHYLAHCVMPSVFVLYAGYRYGWSEKDVGLALMLVGVCSIVVQGGLVRVAIRALGERRALLIGLAFEIAGYLTFGFAPTGAWMLIAILVTAPSGIGPPALQSLMSRHVESNEQGRLQGANSSIMGLTGIVGPGLFALVFAHFISGPPHMALPGAPFMLAGTMVVLGLLIAWRMTRSTFPGGAVAGEGGEEEGLARNA